MLSKPKQVITKSIKKKEEPLFSARPQPMHAFKHKLKKLPLNKIKKAVKSTQNFLLSPGAL